MYQGNVLAMYNLAFCYMDGTGVEQDAEKADAYLKSCADQGDAEAKEELEKILAAIEKEKKQ